jgi:hypothetical protein
MESTVSHPRSEENGEGVTTEEMMDTIRKLIKRLGQFAAERRALITILDELKVLNWEQRLEEIRLTPEYQLIAKQYELLALRMQVDEDFEALARMLQQLDEGKPQN